MPTFIPQLLFHETIYQTTHRHRMKLLLWILSIHLKAKMLNRPFSVRLGRKFLNRSYQHCLGLPVFRVAELPDVWPFVPLSESQISVLVSCLHSPSNQN